MPEVLAPAGVSLPATTVPDTESLRRALLMASWQRDQAVGRRRLRQRWAAWAAQRVGLLALVATGLGWAYLALQPAAADNDASAPVNARTAPALPEGPPAPELPQLPRPALRLDLDPDTDPPPASTGHLPQPSTPGDTRR